MASSPLPHARATARTRRVRARACGYALRRPSAWRLPAPRLAMMGSCAFACCDLEGRVWACPGEKQPGGVPAMAPAVPTSGHQFCRPHYRRNRAEPLAAADVAFTGELRTTVRQQLGNVIRQEPRRPPGPAG